MSRFEFKYPIPKQSSHQVEKHLTFYRNQSTRTYFVSSLYFDNHGDDYHDKVEGNPVRRKVRIRYYGDPLRSDSQVRLEIKHKEWFKTRKDQRWLSREEASRLIERTEIDPWIKNRIPSLWVKYQRTEFNFLKIRLTFDTSISYEHPSSGLSYSSLHSVLEIKTEDVASLNQLPWLLQLGQPQSFSKYVEGIILTNRIHHDS